MSLILNKIKNVAKRKKFNVFLIFCLLAFFILVLARLSATYTNTVKFKVALQNIPDEMVILNDTTNILNFTITANGFMWMQYYLKTPIVNIDFKNEVKKNDALYIWSLARGYPGINTQFNKDITIKAINPDTLTFTVDINTVKLIPIKPNVALNFSPGYNVLNAIETQPDSIKVIGPESLVSKLQVLETEMLIKNNINKPFTAQLKLKTEALDSQIKLDTKAVNININTQKFTEGTLAVPITIINVPKNSEVNYFPKTINVSFYTSLDNYNTINTNEFEVVCDFKEHSSTSTYLTPKLINKPKGIKTARLHQQKIDYIISE